MGLPPRLFLFTLDQIAGMLAISVDTLMRSYVYFEGRSTGARKTNLMIAINIAPDEEKPEWRVNDRELVRWARVKGFRYHEWGAFT